MKARRIIPAGVVLLLVSGAVVFGAGPYPALDAQATARIGNANKAATAAYRKADGQTATAMVTKAPTATPTVAATPTGAATKTPPTCTDLGDGAVDQHGVSVDVWAPGLRIACGFAGYENGEDPMPAGTPFDAPRPFRFDYQYDHNEPVYGFKVFYYRGAANHCGDIREILHQGGGTAGFDTEFHTYQFAYAQCDNEVLSTMRIVDIGGQADLGCLISRTDFNATGEVCPPGSTNAGGQGERITADSNVCTPSNTDGANCITSWYPTLRTDSPNGGTFGVETTLVVYDPITLLDRDSHIHRILTNDALGRSDQNGVVRGLSLMLLFDLQSTVSARFSVVWDGNQHKQVVVADGTPGSWRMRVDGGFAWPSDHPGETAHCDDSHACYGDGTLGLATQRHPATVTTGVQYPN